MKRALIYLRVSTASQAAKGDDPDGYSIPAQRLACLRKADELEAELAGEFVDRAESARSAQRPALQELLRTIEQDDVDYVIVHKIDRLARNRADDVEITMRLRNAGVRLISCSENIDETPSGMLVHGIMSVLAEYYSLNLAHEVIKGSTQKAKAGGLPGKAPVGYVNVRKMTDGIELRTVEVDPVRGPLMQYAFEAYASGDISIGDLLDDLTDRGLTTVGGPNTPSKNLSRSQLHRLLKHPFYKGIVRYKGVEYEGTHEPLVSAELWETVQVMFELRAKSGEKRRKHSHYLKGTVFCGKCKSRLIIMKTTNRHGTQYEYFACLGRHQKRTTCDLKSLPIDQVEQRVIDLYKREEGVIKDPEDMADIVLQEIETASDSITRSASIARTRLQTVKDKQRKLVQAHIEGAVPLDVLKDEQHRLSSELSSLESDIRQDATQSKIVEEELRAALKLVANLHTAYEAADSIARRIFNQAVYTAIFLDDDDNTSGQTSKAIQSLDDLVALGPGKRHPGPVEGLKMHHMVELTGFEPVTPSLRTRCSARLSYSPLRDRGFY